MQPTGIKKDERFIQPGSVIQGKWYKNRYLVIRKIGSGAIGTVLLCRHGKKKVALKLSDKTVSMTAEINVLKSLQQVQDTYLGPFLFEADDWYAPDGNVYLFYVMEYIDGISLEQFIRLRGLEWIGIFLIQLLDQLDRLHRSGWVFGDLKAENMLVEIETSTVRLVDVGGTTKMGRSIKEYSEFYDRASWHLGTRQAEPSYDLFALAMVILGLFYPKKFPLTKGGNEYVRRKLYAVDALSLYAETLEKALFGQFSSANEMKEHLLRALIRKSRRGKQKRNKRTLSFLEPLFIFVFATIYYLIALLS